MDYGKDSKPASLASVFLFPREHSVVSFITVIEHSDGCGTDNTAPVEVVEERINKRNCGYPANGLL